MEISTKIRAKIYLSIQLFLLYLLKYLRKKRSIHNTIDKDLNILRNKLVDSNENEDISIIITTFEARFFEFTIPLINAIRSELNSPIFVVINGDFYKSNRNIKLQKFIQALGNFTDVYPTAFSTFHGCAELWNTGIVNADSENYLILNDDIHIYPKSLKAILPSLRQLILQNGLVTINRSFSHFGLSQRCIEEVGFFDEHFLGIGEEDRDYFYRYEAKYMRKPHDLFTDAFYNFGDEARDNSIKKISDGKYSYFNSVIQEKFYSSDPDSPIQGRYDMPVKRLEKFLDPRPLWKFRKINYQKLGH